MVAPLLSPSNDPLSGYFGHLSKDQQEALDGFKGLLLKDGIQLQPSGNDRYRDRSQGPSELELLRFLRARRFDVPQAYAMYKAAVNWRREIDLDTLYKTFDFENAKRASRAGYLHYYHKNDRSGSPIHIHEFQTMNPSKLFKIITPEDQVRYMFLLNESNFRKRFPGCTEELGRRSATNEEEDSAENASEQGEQAPQVVETVTGIFDIKNVGLMGFWKIKGLLGQVIEISDKYYPETSNRIFIINAPPGFNTVWGYIRSWLDARTVSKIEILGSEFKETLLKHIPPENLPAFYGGSCTCEGLDQGCRNGDVGCWNAR